MTYLLIRFQRRTQNSEYELIGEYESEIQAKVGMFDTIHRERDGFPFVYQMEFNQDSTEGFFIIEGEASQDMLNFVMNNSGVFYAYI